MNNNSQIEFKCIQEDCVNIIAFSMHEIENNATIVCDACNKSYNFHPDFVVKIKNFSKLIEAVQNAKDILGNINVAIKNKDDEIKIPYRLLLTRMNTLITLKMDEGEINFKFRVEPLNKDKMIK